MSESCCGHKHDHEHEHNGCSCGHDHDHKEPETKQSRVNIPIMLLGFAVAAIFLIAIFSYQVSTTEQAVVLTLGKIDENVRQPGLHFRWPFPIQKVMKYDTRLRCYDGNIGKLEETPTSDGKNITISIYTVFRIKDLIKFQSAGGSIVAAEEQLGILMRTAKGAVVGKYRFDQLVNSDPKKIMIPAMEADMLKMIAPNAAEQYGLEVISVNIRTIGVPDNPAKAIAERMISERKARAAEYKSEGEKVSKKIMTDADAARMRILTEAEAQAKKLRAEGDAAAAAHYAVFRENPQLALFLRKLDSMKRLMGERTTLILDTNYAPFDILKYGETLPGEPAKK
ncbi:MAG: hypothetical protein IJW05_09180 [Lentisphaeria bacterium]|nr:hypothetical protein [Lentisphaeria bacterium]